MWPDAAPFDPQSEAAPARLKALLEGPGSGGPVILLAVGPHARHGGWAARTALAIAEAFGSRGDAVVLADLSLDEPELHALAGVDNEEGLTDVFLFGASLEHISRRVEGRSFRLIPASVFTPDASEILQHARWSAVFEEMASSQVRLIVYLPIDVAGAPAFSDRVGDTIVLAMPSELLEVRAALSADADIIWVLTPAIETPAAAMAVVEAAAAMPSVPAGPSFERMDDKEFEKIRIPKDGARDALIADLRSRQRAALMAPPPVMRPLAHEEAIVPIARAPLPPTNRPLERMAPPLFTIRQVPPTPARRWSLWVLLLALAGAGGAGWYILRMPSPAAERVATASKPRATPAPPLPVRTAPAQAPLTSTSHAGPLRYSVAIASYRVFDLARERVLELHKDDARMAFYISPIVVQGALFYRVMAGPVADSMTALTLRDTLLARRIKTGTSAWDVLSTPFAFLLGEYRRAGEAANKQQEAEAKGIPSYIVETAGPDGSPQFKLYAGAYTGPGDAEFMRPILKRAGLPDNLVERTGSIRS